MNILKHWFRNQGITICLIAILSLIHHQVNGTHLMGGSMTYEYQGMSGSDLSYKVTLKIYRYCDASAGGTAPLDPSMYLGIYNQDPLNPNDDKNWYATANLILISSSFITPPSPGADCSFNTTVCVEEGIFEANILLPPDPGGYHLMVERCCRNGNIANLSNPGSIGQTYYCFIPPTPVVNSSPQFSDIPVPFICTGDTVTIVNNAVDPDGDELVYSFEIPYSGYSSSFNAIPDPQFDNNPYAMPIPPVLYNPGYSMGAPFGAGGSAYIDTQTGLTKYFIPNQGFFVVAIEIKEYRAGVLIAAVRRDIQLIAITCPVNATPVLSTASGGGQTSFTISEGQTLCFPITFTDPNGDSLYLTSSGAIFSGAVITPPATLSNANGDGIVTSQFCWSTECGQAKATPYQFVVSVIDNGCPPKITNQIYSVTVTPSPLPPAPDVIIQQNPPGPVCTGTAVTFTAIPTFGGTNPVYQWQLNGVNVGINSNTYSSTTLNNGDIITVTLTSNSVCVTTNTAMSPPVVMVVNPFAAPSVSITQIPLGAICAGTNVTFTANPVNPGATPVYQWTVNGINSGLNSPVFNSTTLTMGSQVAVTLTADASCPDAVSNIINMVVNPVLAPSVLITSDATGAICPGQLVTFRAYPTNGGSVPAYQWQINGVSTGINSNTFSSAALNNGDNVTVILTSNENCVTPLTANSNVITITVTAPTNPAVTISASPSATVCADDNIIFTASPVFGGTTPVYQWQVNGVNTGFGGISFATSSLNSGDQVRVIMTSSLGCLNTNIANSNIIVVTINPVVAVTASISISPSIQFCSGTPVTFLASVVNGGTAPYYQWQVNGLNSGSNSISFTTSTLMDGDRVRVLVTSNQSCVSPVVATSNQITVDVLPVVNPVVSIAVNPPGTVCEGTLVQFTATPVFGGTAPVFQWFVNGNPAGTGGATFVSGILNDGDVVKVNLTSSENCPSPAVAVSNSIVMDVNPEVIPQVSFSVSPGWPVCAGTPVTLSAIPGNGGTAPIFQWQINNIPAGGGSTITFSNLNNGDSIRVLMVSNAICPSSALVYSDTVVAVVLPYLTPQTAIYVNPSGPVCEGDSISFSSAVINGGANPGFQWFVNGTAAGTNSQVFAGLFNDSDTIMVVVNSSYQCLTSPSDTSNIIITNILPNLVPSVSVSAIPQGPVCPGDLITFSATGINSGSTPVYQWLLNGLPVGVNASVYSSSSFINGDQVMVQMTSSELCLVSPDASSGNIVVQVSPNIIPGVNISVTPSAAVCAGDSLTFNATYTGGGPTPTFIWRVNGINNGVVTPDFSSNQLYNGDVIDVILASSAFCALPLTDTSNNIITVINPILTPTAVITANPPGVFCDGASITYSASVSFGGATPVYQWYLNGTQAGGNSDTLISSVFEDGDTLQLQLISSEMCLAFNPAISNLIIIDRLPPLVPVITAPERVCFGEEVTLETGVSGGNGGPYYLNTDHNLGSGISFTFIPYQTTTYTLTVSDSCSTPRSYSATITVDPLPEPMFTTDPQTATILNPYFNFNNVSFNAASWVWELGDGAVSIEQHPSHSYAEPGYYTVVLSVTSSEGCIDSLSKEVLVENVVTYYIPNAFTPNGDGKNDEFKVTGYAISGYEMQIYNRWGQEIFRSSGPFDAWNGLDTNGKPVISGVYTYRLRVLNDPGNKIKNGIVTLVR